MDAQIESISAPAAKATIRDCMGLSLASQREKTRVWRPGSWGQLRVRTKRSRCTEHFALAEEPRHSRFVFPLERNPVTPSWSRLGLMRVTAARGDWDTLADCKESASSCGLADSARAHKQSTALSCFVSQHRRCWSTLYFRVSV